MAKIQRNDPCPCGSGKKYKYCCGRISKENKSENEIQVIFPTSYSAEGGFSISLNAQDAEYLLYALDIRPELYKDKKIVILSSTSFERLLKICAVDILNGKEVKRGTFDFNNLAMKGIANGKIIAEYTSNYRMSYVKNDNSKLGISLLSNEDVSEIDILEHNKQIKALGIGTEIDTPKFVCSSEKNQVDYIKKLLNEDVSFLRFLISNIFDGGNIVSDFKQYEKLGLGWEKIKNFVSDDTFGILRKWGLFNENYDYNNMVLAPYDKSLEIPKDNKDLYSEYKCGKVSLLQVAVFHEYLLEYLIKRFTDYRFLSQNILRNDNSLTSVFHKGFDIMLAIAINVELQLGVHLVFQNAGKDFPNMFVDDNSWFKKIAQEYPFEYYKALPNGLHMLLNSYFGTIDQIMENYNPYEEFNCVYLNNHPMYKEELESLAEIVYMNLPQGNGFFLDYKSALRAMCAGLICGNVETRSRLFKLSLQLCTQMDYIKMFFGVEKSEILFNSNKNTHLSREDFVKKYHEAVFYWFDEKNGINYGSYPENLNYVDDDGYDALLRTDGFWLKNPSLRERFYYDYRHLRVEIFEMLSGTFFELRDEAGSIKGIYPLIPFYAENNLRFSIKDDEGRNISFQNTNNIDITEDRLFYLGFIREIDEIPIASFREYMTAPVFYSWLKQKEAMEIIQQKNKELEETNDDLNRHIKLNMELVRSLSHASANYLNSDKLAQTGAELHVAKNDNPTLEKLHYDGLLLLLQSEHETYMRRRLDSLVIRCSASGDELKRNIRDGLSNDETGLTIYAPLEYAIRTVLSRIITRDDDIRSIAIRKKFKKTDDEWKELRNSFISDVLADNGQALDWCNKNLCQIKISVTELWNKIKIIEDKAFFDLIVEILTEQILNSFSHGDLNEDIKIEFGEADGIKRKGRIISTWCFIRTKNMLGDRYKGGRQTGIKTLSSTLLLLNGNKRGMEQSESENEFITTAWLEADLLRTLSR